jgi:amidase
MSITRPTLDALRLTARSLHLTFSDAELLQHLSIMMPTFAAFDLVDALPDNVPAVTVSRAPGDEPSAVSNDYNAWARRTSIRETREGPLSGHQIVLKDNIALAGVPMINGSATLQGYVPDFDATVVTRILAAGGEIVGKAHCEALCLSGGSHTSARGAVRNPHDEHRSSGGSSSGCAALVGGGKVAMAIGGDQGGSIRIPSSWSGCVGMKPTWGLVPYSGIMPIEATIDHTGPITGTVADNALLLEVLAGEDALDPRQYGVRTAQYTGALHRDVKGLRIGLIEEGFGRPESERDVDETVRAAAERLSRAGATLRTISHPWHNIGGAIWPTIALEGLTQQMMLGNGTGMNWKGLYSTGLLKAHSMWKSQADELAPTIKNSLLAGKYMLDRYGGRSYAKAQNIARRMRAEYDHAFSSIDLMILPTTPMKATLLPPADATLEIYIQRAFEMIGNTCPANVTGHPALSMPCGISEGLPVGLMMVGRHFEESTIYRAASVLEQLLK